MLAKDLYDPAEFAAISENYKTVGNEDASYTSSFAAGTAKVKREDYVLYLYEKSIKPFHLCVKATTAS